MEERMAALEDAVWKSIKEPSPQPSNPKLAPQVKDGSYAAVAVSSSSKPAVRIRISCAEKLQPEQLLSMAKEHIHGAYAVPQMRSNDKEVYVQSAIQRDAALNMPQPDGFKILRQIIQLKSPVYPLKLG